MSVSVGVGWMDVGVVGVGIGVSNETTVVGVAVGTGAWSVSTIGSVVVAAHAGSARASTKAANVRLTRTSVRGRDGLRMSLLLRRFPRSAGEVSSYGAVWAKPFPIEELKSGALGRAGWL